MRGNWRFCVGGCLSSEGIGEEGGIVYCSYLRRTCNDIRRGYQIGRQNLNQKINQKFVQIPPKTDRTRNL